VCQLLHQLGVDWPWAPEAPSAPQAVAAWKRVLSQCPHAVAGEQGPGTLFAVRLRSFLEQQGLQGYDPSLDVLLVTEEELRALAELECAAQRSMVSSSGAEALGGTCTVLHVVSAEEELQQQKADLLWRMLEPGALSAAQVRAALASCPPEGWYLQCPYSGPLLCTDESWTEVIRVLTSAAIRFEMLSAAHRSQITLDLADGGISTKGTRSGAFVMYNCARMATLFQTYQQAVEQGTYPALPPPPELDFSCLREEGEWLLLFNHILPFPELLQQAAQLPISSSTIRITANTEAVRGGGAGGRQGEGQTLGLPAQANVPYVAGVQVPGPAQHGLQLLLQPCPCPGGESCDWRWLLPWGPVPTVAALTAAFSPQEPLPHLFPPMLARLQLLSAVRDVLHSALATLHLPPLNQV
uniref:DALR anticodon binding domain containing 3 n=1 Tax=Crocodylus porosus TaxID=8502 RepID=A0A7M4FI57_CROPO